MIKIELTDEKKKKIEKMFLEDLLGDDHNGKRKGKFITILDNPNNRDLLQKKYKKLYDYLYDNNKEVKKDEVRKLLLSDRAGMGAFINEFGSYDRKIPDERDLSDKLLKTIFQYENFSKRKVAYELLKEIDITVCPYCNRLYIMTLKKHRVRPQLDHYFPKSRYPYLALSLYNLIPSCSVCNMAKSDMDTKENPILYPYEEEFGEKVVFGVDIPDKDEFVKCITGIKDDFNIDIKNSEQFLEQQVENQNSRLHITDLYNEHKDYVKDILLNYHINTDKRIQELLNTFPTLFSTKEEIQSLIFMNDISKENWGKRPMAKLTHDIYKDLEKKNLR